MSKIEKLIESKDRKLERKQFTVAEFKVVDAPQGIIEAIVSVFNNEDDGGDTVRSGAFTASILADPPAGVWMHEWTQPVAKSLVSKELEPGDTLLPEKLKLLGGLYIKGQFNLDTQRGREAFSDIQFGIVKEFSIGYYATKVLWDEEKWTRELIECELVEWSPVLRGMNRETVLISAKSKEGAGDALMTDLEAVGDAVAGARRLTERLKARLALRRKDHRGMGQLAYKALDMSDELRGIIQAIDDLVDMALGEPEDTEPGEEGKRLSRHQMRVKIGKRISSATAGKIQDARNGIAECMGDMGAHHEDMKGTMDDMQSFLELLDELLDAATGEPEDEEPADAGKASLLLAALEAKRSKAHAGIASVMLGAMITEPPVAIKQTNKQAA